MEENFDLKNSIFNELYEKCDLLELEEFLDSNQYPFEHLLYNDLQICEDKEKVKKFIKTNNRIFDAEIKFKLLLEKFSSSEIKEILLNDSKLLIKNIENIFGQENINPVELIKDAINIVGDEISETFLKRIIRMDLKSEHEIKEILNIIGINRIKNFIKENARSCGFRIKAVKTIIIFLREEPFFKECIFDKSFQIDDEVKMDILEEVNDISLFHECLEKSDLFGKDFIIECLKHIGNTKLTLKYLFENKFNFTDEDKLYLILQSNDFNFIKKCMYDKKLKLSSMSKVILLTKIPDKQYVRECIDDKPLELNEPDITFLKLFYEIGIEEYIESIKDNRIMLNTKKDSTKGIEIECGGTIDWYVVEIINTDESLRSYTMPNNQKWKFDQDGSGIELSSYVMKDDEQATNTIYYACHLLKEAGQDVTQDDGGHVNIGDNILTNKQSYINLLDIWLNLEKVMFLVSNKEGELPRFAAIEVGFASPISQKMNENIINRDIRLKGNESKEEFIEKLNSKIGEFSSIYLGNIGSKDGSRIEFRTPNGTLNPQTWIENINFFAALVQTAEDLYQIQIKSENERTEKENEALELLEKIKSMEVKEEDKVECLLSLIMDDEKQRDIYRRRYRVNSKLLEKEENSELKSEIDKETATYFIGFDPKAIGEYCFANTDVESEKLVYNRLSRDMENQRNI